MDMSSPIKAGHSAAGAFVAGFLRLAIMMGIGIALVLAVWASLIHFYEIPLYLAPPPSAVWEAILEKHALLASHLGFTLAAAATGLAISSVCAIALAIMFVNSPLVSQAAFPLVVALRTAPVVAIAPLITLIVGRGFATSVTVVVIVTFFPLLVNLLRGLAAADRNCLELMHVYGASRWQQMRLARIPFSLPYFFAGLRIAGASAILGAMIAEWLTGVKGIGYLILDSADLREVELMWAAIAASMAVALGIFWVAASVERSVLHWKE